MPYDIMPAKDTQGAANMLQRGTMTSGEVFAVGDIIAKVDAGTITEPHDDGAQVVTADADSGQLFGVAASPGVDPSTGTSLPNPRTGVAYAAGDEILYWPAGRGILFKTKNFITAGGTTGTGIPPGTIVGESLQVTYGTAATIGWGVENTAGVDGTDLLAIVHSVLDARGRPIAASDTTTGVWVIFELKVSK